MEGRITDPIQDRLVCKIKEWVANMTLFVLLSNIVLFLLNYCPTFKKYWTSLANPFLTLEISHLFLWTLPLNAACCLEQSHVNADNGFLWEKNKKMKEGKTTNKHTRIKQNNNNKTKKPTPLFLTSVIFKHKRPAYFQKN